MSTTAERDRTDLLFEAVGQGDSSRVRELVESGMSPDTVRDRGCLLGNAALHGRVEIVRLLLELGADPNGAEPARGYCTPLMWAAHGGQVDIVALLLASGADPNALVTSLTGDHGDDALVTACESAYSQLLAHRSGGPQGNDTTRLEQVVRLLLEAGADPNHRPKRHGAWGSGPTALEAALAGGCAGIARILLEHGAALAAQAMESAVRSRDAATVELLLERGLKPDADAVADATWGPEPMALRLLESMPDTDRPGLEKVLRIAAGLGRLEVMRAVLAKGADVDARGDAGPGDVDTTALAAAAQIGGGGPGTVELLLRHGADPNRRSGFYENTPLMLAADRVPEQEAVAIARVLLEHGANPREKPNRNGETAESIAALHKHEQLSRLLSDARRPRWLRRLLPR